MSLPERKKSILKTIIENYILSAEPVGSKWVAETLGSLSSATIRHEMSELEDMGLLEKPHVSAGRVPSPLAYRVYVDELMEQYTATSNEIEDLQRELTEKLCYLDDVVENASKILSEITNYTGISFTRRKSTPVFSKIQLIPIENTAAYALIAVTTGAEIKNRIIALERPVSDEEISVLVTSVNKLLKERSSPDIFQAVLHMMSPTEALYPLAAKVFDFICNATAQTQNDIHIDGAARLLSQPEFKDTEKAVKILSFLADRTNVSEIVQPQTENTVNIQIAPQTKAGQLDDTAFIFTTYDMGDDVQGVIGVIGPSRMDYAGVAAKLELFAKTLGKHLPIRFEYTDKNDK